MCLASFCSCSLFVAAFVVTFVGGCTDRQRLRRRLRQRGVRCVGANRFLPPKRWTKEPTFRRWSPVGEYVFSIILLMFPLCRRLRRNLRRRVHGSTKVATKVATKRRSLPWALTVGTNENDDKVGER